MKELLIAAAERVPCQGLESVDQLFPRIGKELFLFLKTIKHLFALSLRPHPPLALPGKAVSQRPELFFGSGALLLNLSPEFGKSRIQSRGFPFRRARAGQSGVKGSVKLLSGSFFGKEPGNDPADNQAGDCAQGKPHPQVPFTHPEHFHGYHQNPIGSIISENLAQHVP